MKKEKRRAQEGPPLLWKQGNRARRRIQAEDPLFWAPLFRKQGKSRRNRPRGRGPRFPPQRAPLCRFASSRLHQAPPRTSTPITSASPFDFARWTISSVTQVRPGRWPGTWTTSSCIWAAQRSRQALPQQSRRRVGGRRCWKRWRRWRKTAPGSWWIRRSAAGRLGSSGCSR
ncbi:hypothetical protein PVAP13_3NG276441 [Panicum virgatum]|uniref:Uncharacterized protein n=1 Tax=Panicum virgatum TaxID=38727 RepID=A0A8T0UI68_PANVG|nr:hypothetical protein PVAP13_3NG276441 [Panicum virgatum]